MRLRALLLTGIIATSCLAQTPAAPARTAAPATTFLAAEPAAWPAGSWARWKSEFLMPDGRVIDNGNKGISHSEGQGYGMLLAALANDAATFERIWAWTSKNLYIRADGLAAWKWVPDQEPHIVDENNASDGDLLIAWALSTAAERWNKPDYAQQARRIAIALDTETGIRSNFGRALLPGVGGFKIDHRKAEEDGPVVNPSYWVFPALEQLRTLAPALDWDGYRASGYALLTAARFGNARLPTDWVSIKTEKPVPAKGFAPVFSYNAVRIPLYLAWARHADAAELLKPFVKFYESNDSKVFEYNVETQENGPEMTDPGYKIIFALAKCSLDGTKIPDGLRSVNFDRYYPATLQLLALYVARTRFDKCV